MQSIIFTFGYIAYGCVMTSELMPEEDLPLPFVMINPEILDASEELYFPAKGEGCLSVLGPIRGKVARHYSIHVKF